MKSGKELKKEMFRESQELENDIKEFEEISK